MDAIRGRHDPTIWRKALRTLGVCLTGCTGGALSGFVITGLPVPQTLESAGSLVDVLKASLDNGEMGALVGAPFGLVVFPILYLTICRDVPLRLVVSWGIPATIVSEISYLYLTTVFGDPFDGLPGGFFWLEIYLGGFLGLLIACIALRMFARGRQRSS